MQVNELVGQVWQGTRLTDIDRAFNDTRATLETQAERRGGTELRRTGQNPDGREAVAGTTRMPRRYGAGF